MIVQGVHGLASVLGVIESVLEDDIDNTTCITLMICCKSEEDIVAYKSLQQKASYKPEKL
jgi:hypothetical protein|tara:strand:+ start:354 stop:533 length:180 start_codon:yes stop_codon:yes gene_type:complete